MDVEIENYMKTLNLEEICRTCLSECDEMTSLYADTEPTEVDEISYVYQVLMNVSSIQVMVDDGLPTLICKNCVENANNAFKFKILCERSEALLRTYLTEVSSGDNLYVKEEEDSTEFLDNVENLEDTVEIDHDYISDHVYENSEFEGKEEVVVTIEQQNIVPAIAKISNENIQQVKDNRINISLTLQHESDTDNIDEEFIERLEEEFQTEETDTSKLKELLCKNFSEDPLSIQILNSSVQDIIVKPDMPFESYADESKILDDSLKDAIAVASSEENIDVREKFKLKKISGQNGVSKPRKKRNLIYNSRMNENGEKVFACNYCDKEYKHSTSLTVHIRSHTSERPYVCKLCRKTFKQLTSLTYHMRSHTGETPYKCTMCEKRYRQSASLTAHMRVHTGQKPFLCSVCGKGFRQAPDLGYHMRTHTKEKPYMCSVCGKRMSMQCHLVQHMRTHTGEKPFSCKECGKSFPSSTRLKRHEIIHTDLRPFKCEVCNKSFNRASTLKVHVMTHSEEKPHVCKICGKGFIQHHCLKSHMKTHCAFEDIFIKTEDPEDR